jgi:hypothetical protein
VVPAAPQRRLQEEEEEEERCHSLVVVVAFSHPGLVGLAQRSQRSVRVAALEVLYH